MASPVPTSLTVAPLRTAFLGYEISNKDFVAPFRTIPLRNHRSRRLCDSSASIPAADSIGLLHFVYAGMAELVGSLLWATEIHTLLARMYQCSTSAGTASAALLALQQLSQATRYFTMFSDGQVCEHFFYIGWSPSTGWQ